MQVKNVCRLLALLLCAVLLVAIAACAPEDAGADRTPSSTTSSRPQGDLSDSSTTTTKPDEANKGDGQATTTTTGRVQEDGLGFGDVLDGTTTTTTTADVEQPDTPVTTTTTTEQQADVTENSQTTTTTEADWFGKDEGYLPPVGF